MKEYWVVRRRGQGGEIDWLGEFAGGLTWLAFKANRKRFATRESANTNCVFYGGTVVHVRVVPSLRSRVRKLELEMATMRGRTVVPTAPTGSFVTARPGVRGA